MSISVSFYKPVDYFSGFFNRFVTWFTSGQYCHCDLVIHTTPTDVMNTVKYIYTDAQQNKYAPEDAQRIISQIELAFFDTAFRRKVQTCDEITLAFSFLWGYPMTVRVLTETAHDTWFKIPSATDGYASMLKVHNVDEEQVKDTLKFAIEEIGKTYDTSGALCSWLPFGESSGQTVRESYFCSEFVAMALQRVGLIGNIIASKTTPNSLYQHLSQQVQPEEKSQ